MEANDNAPLLPPRGMNGNDDFSWLWLPIEEARALPEPELRERFRTFWVEWAGDFGPEEMLALTGGREPDALATAEILALIERRQDLFNPQRA
jgi:hypothetical protein